MWNWSKWSKLIKTNIKDQKSHLCLWTTEKFKPKIISIHKSIIKSQFTRDIKTIPQTHQIPKATYQKITAHEKSNNWKLFGSIIIINNLALFKHAFPRHEELGSPSRSLYKFREKKIYFWLPAFANNSKKKCFCS